MEGFDLEANFTGADTMDILEGKVVSNSEQRRGQDGLDASEREQIRKRKAEEMIQEEVKKRERKEEKRLEMERRKQDEKRERERKREDEKIRKEEEREQEKREKEQRKEFEKLERERLKEEERELKQRARDEAKAAREAERQRLHEIREKARERAREETCRGLPDDSTLELEALRKEHALSLPEGQQMPGGAHDESMQIALPQFPPEELRLASPMPGEDVCDEELGELFLVTNFISSFGDLFGLEPYSLGELYAAIQEGETSHVLGHLYVTLLKALIFDAEEAHRNKPQPSTNHVRVEQERYGIAKLMEEAWAWGYDTDTWRAHLNALTWPEVLRQIAVALGCGARRPKPKPQPKVLLKKPAPASTAHLVEHAPIDPSELRMPSSFGKGTVKAAAWQVLSTAGIEGLTIQQIAEKIQTEGLRDLSTSKTPEASVTGALSRDVVFYRVKPSTYCLRSIYMKVMRPKGQVAQEPAKEPAMDLEAAVAAESPEEGCAQPEQMDADVQQEPEAMAVESGEAETPKAQDAIGDAAPEIKASTTIDINVVAEIDINAAPNMEGEAEPDKMEEEEPEEQEQEKPEKETLEDNQQCEAWVRMLQDLEYHELPVLERVHALAAVVHAVVDGGTVRGRLDNHMEKMDEMKRHMSNELLELRRRIKQKETQEQQALTQGKYPDAAEQEGGAGDLASPAAQAAAGRGDMATPQAHVQIPWQDLTPSGVTALLDEKQNPILQEAQFRKRRSEILRQTEEKYPLRLDPLGVDRRHNRYFRFWRPSGAEVQGAVARERVFVSTDEGTSWKVVTSAAQFDELLAALNPKGLRENKLQTSLKRISEPCKLALESSVGLTGLPKDKMSEADNDWLFSIRTAATELLDKQKSRQRGGPVEKEVRCAWCQERVQHDAEMHCARTHVTFKRKDTTNEQFSKYQRQVVEKLALELGVDFPKEEPPMPAVPASRVQKLKRELLDMEHGIPNAAVDSGSFKRDDWLQQVRQAEAVPELRDALLQLEKSLKPDFVAATFQRAPPDPVLSLQPLPGATWAPGGLPATTAAVGLRMVALDAAIIYQKESGCMRDGDGLISKVADAYQFSQPVIPFQMAGEVQHYESENYEDEDDNAPISLNVARSARGKRSSTSIMPTKKMDFLEQGHTPRPGHTEANGEEGSEYEYEEEEEEEGEEDEGGEYYERQGRDTGRDEEDYSESEEDELGVVEDQGAGYS
ncbi:hypothetical protein CYMTET_48404 [Cymbomonas tetramitiformis]|uniref:DDT domain-containing protein n=1 Tax=Cymbomonas tetramitiformis TaxID=36881 RepID=A0AAE0BSB1_9CHLO|nr:hypothetical protein CYMTET_48404 [Cymbomonas tetramitiformis]|eukprot:gene8064-9576_t